MEIQQFEELEAEDAEMEYEIESTNKQQSDVEKNYNTVMEPAEIERDVVMNVSNHVLHYKEAENLIQKKCKEFVQGQEAQKNTSSILVQKKMRIVDQITKEQKLVEVLKLEAEKISTQETRSREEIAQSQQFVENAGEIKEKLQEYTQTLFSKIKNINTGLEETFKKIESQNENFEKNIKVSVSNIRSLKKALDSERNSKNGDDYDSIKKENTRLKQIILDKKNYLKTLKTRFEEGKKLEELNCQLQEDKEKLKIKLNEFKRKFTEIQCKTEQAIIDRNFIVTSLQQECEAKKQRMVSLENGVADTMKKITETFGNIKKLEGEIYEERSKFDDIKAKTEDVKKKIEELEMKLNSEEYKNKLNDVKKKIEVSENALIALTMENTEKIKMYEELSQAYSSKMEEKNGVVVEKEAEMNKNQLNAIKNQLLDEKISTVEIKIQEANHKFNNISSEPSLLELTKKKTYVETCKMYHEENVKILENEKFEAQKTLNKLNQEVQAIKNKIKEVRNDTSSNHRNMSSTPIAGILKRDNQPRKSTSPKTVQFMNVSSEESTENSYDKDQQAPYSRVCANYAKLIGRKQK